MFRTHPITHSARTRSLIPPAPDHRFRPHPITDSGPTRSPIPAAPDHLGEASWRGRERSAPGGAARRCAWPQMHARTPGAGSCRLARGRWLLVFCWRGGAA